MSKRRSLVRQVNQALDTVMRIGQSRHQAKIEGTADRKIFSFKTRSTYGDRCIAAVKRIKALDPNVRELRDISHDHLRAYITDCEDRGLAGGSIRGTIAALHKLEHGLRALRWWSSPEPFVPTDLRTSTHKSPPRLGHSWPDAQRLLNALQGEAQLAARLALSSGLRASEIAHLREEDLDRQAGIIRVRSASAKGGRARTVTELHNPSILRDLPTGRNWIFDNPGGLVRRVEKQIARTMDELGIDRGTGRNLHGLRAAYAERFLRDRIERGIDEDQARRELTRQLGHNRIDVTYRYCPRLS